MMPTRQTLHITGAVRSAQLQYELTEAVAGCPDAHLDLRIGELNGFGRELVRGGTRPDVLLLEVDVHDDRDMQVLGRLSAEASLAGIPVVATAGDLGPAALRRLLPQGVCDFIAQPIDRAEVLDALRITDHLARRPAPVRQGRGRIFTFSRATGGAGATTLAVNVAHALARPHGHIQARVCLIDLDLQFGTAALQLDLQPSDALLALARATTLDATLLANSLVEHGSGVRVLTAPSAPLPLEALRPAGVSALLELVRAEFDFVVIDLPVALTRWTKTVLGHSDLVYLVTQLNIPAVRQLRRLLDTLEAQDLPVQLVLNRAQSSFWGAGLRRRQAENALGRPFDFCIADQFEVLVDAANRGAPVLDVRRYSRFGRQLRDMLDRSARELTTRSGLAAPAAR